MDRPFELLDFCHRLAATHVMMLSRLKAMNIDGPLLKGHNRSKGHNRHIGIVEFILHAGHNVIIRAYR